MSDKLLNFLDAMYAHFREHADEDLGVFPNHRELFATIRRLIEELIDMKTWLNPTMTDSNPSDVTDNTKEENK